MRETKFKVLEFNGIWVDEALLHKGIYSCQIPKLHSKDETVDLIIKRLKMMKSMSGESFFSEEYVDNLKKCKLVDVEINIL